MRLMIVEIIIFSTCIVKWSRAFCSLVIKIMVLAVSTALVGVISGGSWLICASNHCIMGKFCWVLNNRSQQVGGLVASQLQCVPSAHFAQTGPKMHWIPNMVDCVRRPTNVQWNSYTSNEYTKQRHQQWIHLGARLESNLLSLLQFFLIYSLALLANAPWFYTVSIDWKNGMCS